MKMNIKFVWISRIILVLIDLSHTVLPCQPFCNVPSAWISQAKSICYGARGEQYAVLEIKQDCQLVAIRLTHISGLLQCHTMHRQTRWGCPTHDLTTIIVKGTSRSSLFAPESVKGPYAGYSIPGFGMDDDVIILKKRANVTKGEKFHIYYGEDWTNYYEPNNKGRHCIGVDISCLV